MLIFGHGRYATCTVLVLKPFADCTECADNARLTGTIPVDRWAEIGCVPSVEELNQVRRQSLEEGCGKTRLGVCPHHKQNACQIKAPEMEL